jgi:superfamily II DNA or RNA helicase
MLEKRPYQDRIHTKALKAYDAGAISCLIESPTGSGKTVMGLGIAQEMERRGMRIGWVAMRRNLLAQAKAENEEKFGIKNIEFISMFQKELPKVDFMVLDECHHQACGTCVTLLNRAKPKKYLGMTATPFRTDRMQLSFQKVIKDAGIHLLIQEGYLAPYEHFIIPKWSPPDVAAAYAEEKERWGKSVMFFLTVEECYTCQAALLTRGIQSEVITANTDRDEQLDRFDRGEIPVVLNVYILSEGFDCPDLKTVWVRPSSKSPTIQMAGRVFRKHPSKPFAQIVQSEDASFTIVDHARALNRYTKISGQWLSIRGNDNLQRAHLRALQTIAASKDVKMPDHIKKALTAGQSERATWASWATRQVTEGRDSGSSPAASNGGMMTGGFVPATEGRQGDLRMQRGFTPRQS